jgi:hypothetical protein
VKWFRFYHDAIDHPKVQRLPGDLFKFWVNVLCLASRSDDRGLVKLDLEAIAFATRTTDEEAAAMIADLTRRNLLEECTEGLAVHNWENRQFKSDNVAERVAKHRQNAGANEDVTLHETLHPSVNTDSDTEEKEKEKGGVHTPPPTTAPERPKQGKRLPADFAIDDAMRQWAIDRGATVVQVETETEKFVNYWTAESGARARKLDWSAAWKVWMGRNLSGSGSLTVHQGGRANGKDATEEDFARWKRERNGAIQFDEPDDVIEARGIAR